jgi:hypothetical protein
MAAWQPLPEPMPIDTFSPSFNFCQKSLIQFLKLYNRSHSVLNIEVSWDFAVKFCLPPPSAGLGLMRPHRGLMAAWLPLPEPMPIDTFSPSLNFCQKSLIQFLKLYNRSHSVLDIDVSWDYCSKILPTTTLCLPWPA